MARTKAQRPAFPVKGVEGRMVGAARIKPKIIADFRIAREMDELGASLPRFVS